jgi:hypothetical protein
MPEWDSEIEVGEELARRLIAEQFPQLDVTHLRRLGEGWDNTVWATSEQIAFRFPRRQIALGGVKREMAILPELASRLPARIPDAAYAVLSVPNFHGLGSEAGSSPVRRSRSPACPLTGGAGSQHSWESSSVACTACDCRSQRRSPSTRWDARTCRLGFLGLERHWNRSPVSGTAAQEWVRSWAQLRVFRRTRTRSSSTGT